MPPRYAYWTIIVDDQPTAFRAGAQEDLMPTFKRLKEKHPSAMMMWFQNGKLWPSRLDAQEAMRARGEMGRRGDERQAAASAIANEDPIADVASARTGSPRPTSPRDAGAESKPKTSTGNQKATFTPARPIRRSPSGNPRAQVATPRRPRKPSASPTRSPSGSQRARSIADRKPEWKPKGSFERGSKRRLEAKGARSRSESLSGSRRDRSIAIASPSGSRKARFDRERKLDWKPESQLRADSARALEWTPKPQPGAERREAQVGPKEEYKKSMGIEAKRDSKWRPGGEHKDPRQKYKDAKKAKWTTFKRTIRTRWESREEEAR